MGIKNKIDKDTANMIRDIRLAQKVRSVTQILFKQHLKHNGGCVGISKLSTSDERDLGIADFDDQTLSTLLYCYMQLNHELNKKSV